MGKKIAIFAMLTCRLFAVEQKDEKKEVKSEKPKRHWRRSVPRPVVLYAPAQTWKSAIITGVATGLVERAAADIARDELSAGFGPARTVQHQEAAMVADTMAAVTITSIPSGATVKIFGSVIGQTPVKTRLAPGSYKAVASLRGYGNSEAVLEVEPNGKPEFEVTLAPLDPDAGSQRQPDTSIVTLK